MFGSMVTRLAGLADELEQLPMAADDTERIDAIVALERLKGAVAGAQAWVVAEFAASQQAQQTARLCGLDVLSA